MTSITDKYSDRLTRQAIQLQRGGEGLVGPAVVQLSNLYEDVTQQIQDANVAGLSKESDRYRRLTDLQKTVKQTVEVAYGKIDKTITGEIRELADIAQTGTVKILNGVMHADIFHPSFTRGDLESLVKTTLVEGNTASDWWKKQSADVQFRFQQEMNKGLLAGESNDQLIRRIRGVDAGTKTVEVRGKMKRIHVFTGGVMEVSTKNAAALVRTYAHTVAQNTILETYKGNSDLIKGIRPIVTLDGRTTVICISWNGAAWDLITGEPLPESTVKKPFPGPPPWHWNAIVAGELVNTQRGEIPIDCVLVGDLVLTHRGRWRRVYATMGKQHRGSHLRLHLDSGRVLRVTDEHPLLAVGRGWLRADELQVGDNLFQQTQEVSDVGTFDLGWVSQNAPAIVDERFVPDQFSLLPPRCCPLGVDFDHEHCSRKSEVGDVSINGKLESVDLESRGPQGIKEEAFSKCRPRSQIPCAAECDSSCDSGVPSGVTRLHDVRVDFGQPSGGFTIPRAPVTGTTRVRSRLTNQSDRLGFSPSLNSKLTTPAAHGVGLKTKTSIDLAQRDVLAPVHFVKDSADLAGWLHTTIIRVEREGYQGRVYNLAVEEDETYHVNDVVVHNCRTTLAPITKSWDELIEDASGKRLKELNSVPDSERASVDGRIGGDVDYSDWLKGRTKAEQIDILGEARWKLWKDGKITLAQLTDQSGNPLTIAQLRERVGKGLEPSEEARTRRKSIPVKSKASREAVDSAPAATVLADLKKATAAQEMVTLLKSYEPVTKIRVSQSFYSLDPETVRSAANGIVRSLSALGDEVLKDTANFKLDLKRLSVKKLKPEIVTTTTDKGELTFNSEWYRDPARATNVLKRESDRGAIIAATPEEAVMHETAHSIKRAIDAVPASRNAARVRGEFKELLGNGYRGISELARTSGDEMFAEFWVYIQKTPREEWGMTAKRIADKMRELLHAMGYPIPEVLR